MNALIPVVATLAAAIVAVTPAAMADEASEARPSTIVTDFAGRPPFARERVTVAEAASLARLEEVSGPVSASQARDFRRRPPFRRDVSTPDEPAAAVFARFEEVDADVRRRHGPPGKPGSRR